MLYRVVVQVVVLLGSKYCVLSEATEKTYCDEELSKTEAEKGELEGVISRLTSKIDLAAAKSAELKSEVTTLSAELATIAKEQAEMDTCINKEQQVPEYQKCEKSAIKYAK